MAINDPYLESAFGLAPRRRAPTLPALGEIPMPAVPAAPRPPVGGLVRGGLPRVPPPMPGSVQGAPFGVGMPREASAEVMSFRNAMGAWRPPMRLPGAGGSPLPAGPAPLDLLQARIRDVESSGRYDARNKRSSASGAYQYIDSTWNNFGGYPSAAFAPPEVQDAKFLQDLRERAARYNNDPYKMIAAHYLPAQANDPSQWGTRYRLKNGTTVDPVEQYVRKVIRGTPLEANFDAYLLAHQR